MRILANENFPEAAVTALRHRGHDVAWVRTDAPGSSDQEVLARANSEGRVVITFDKGFGELAFHWGLPASSGVILFRTQASADRMTLMAIAALESRSDWAGYFAVVEDDRIRVTLLPETGS